MNGTSVQRALTMVSEPGMPDIDALVTLLTAEDEADVRLIFETADAVRRRFMGDGVLLRGIVEFSSFCSNTCYYCGLHGGNARITRYRMGAAEILESVAAIAAQDIRTVVLQSGEDEGLDASWLADVVRQIKRHHDMAVTLSVGERPRDEYRLWREAGADRFLLKIEASDADLYGSLHARRTVETRMRCLRDLADLGYQVGCGIMVGLPGQGPRHIAVDIRFFAENDFDMIGIGPFIPHPETRFRDAPLGSVPLTLKTLALTRIVTRNSHLPATTSLGSMDRDYRPDGLKAGANVLMPNFTPLSYKRLYEIYPGKRCVGEPTGACGACIESMASAIGRTIDHSRGDTRKMKVRIS